MPHGPIPSGTGDCLKRRSRRDYAVGAAATGASNIARGRTFSGDKMKTFVHTESRRPTKVALYLALAALAIAGALVVTRSTPAAELKAWLVENEKLAGWAQAVFAAVAILAGMAVVRFDDAQVRRREREQQRLAKVHRLHGIHVLLAHSAAEIKLLSELHDLAPQEHVKRALRYSESVVHILSLASPLEIPDPWLIHEYGKAHALARRFHNYLVEASGAPKATHVVSVVGGARPLESAIKSALTRCRLILKQVQTPTERSEFARNYLTTKAASATQPE